LLREPLPETAEAFVEFAALGPASGCLSDYHDIVGLESALALPEGLTDDPLDPAAIGRLGRRAARDGHAKPRVLLRAIPVKYREIAIADARRILEYSIEGPALCQPR